jgi:hypothetical protein
MYQEGTLRPPSPLERDRKWMALEFLRVEHVDILCGPDGRCCQEKWHIDPIAPSMWHIIELCQRDRIPYEVRIQADDDGVYLDWS